MCFYSKVFALFCFTGWILSACAGPAADADAPLSESALSQPADGLPRSQAATAPAPGTANPSTGQAGRSDKSYRPPRASFCYTFEEQARFDDNLPGFPYDQVLMHETFMHLAVPLYLQPTWRILSGLDFQFSQFNFRGGSDPNRYSETKNLYAIGIPLRLSMTLPKKWTGAIMAAPALYSDMEEFHRDDLRFTGMALGSYQWSDQLKLAIGLAYGRIFGREMPFPVAGLIWDPKPDWRINLMFPNPGIIYSPTKRLSCMAIITPSGNEWNLSKDFTGNDGDYDLRFKGFRIGLRLEYELTEHLIARGASGLVFRRNYELLEDDETMVESDVGDTWFAQIGLAWH